MKKTVMLALVVCALAVGLAFGAMKGSADVVKVSATAKTLTAKAGTEVTFAVTVAIQDNWHLYAHGDTNFIGMDLVPDEGFPLTDFAAVYPKGHEGEFFGEKVVMVDGKDTIAVTAMVPADLPAGDHALGFKVTAQACDDKTCLAPAYLPVAIKLTVE
jgi:hypothetical protein